MTDKLLKTHSLPVQMLQNIHAAELPDWKDGQKEEQIFFGYIFSPSILKLYQLEQYKTIS